MGEPRQQHVIKGDQPAPERQLAKGTRRRWYVCVTLGTAHAFAHGLRHDAPDQPGGGVNSYRPGVTSRRPSRPNHNDEGWITPAPNSCSVRTFSPSASNT